MAKKIVFAFLLFGIINYCFSQTIINPKNIEIIRDSFGVPHIYTNSDDEAAYGIAWAQCEDNFKIMQENLAVVRGQAGSLLGVEGAGMDFIAAIFELDKMVEEKYAKEITPKIEGMIRAYVTAFKDYADAHPEEIILKNFTPPTISEIIQLYNFNFIILTWAVFDVAKLTGNDMDLYKTFGEYKPNGSNAIAYNSNKTSDDKTYLVANPHLPTKGGIRFWEVGVHTKEGLDIHGVTFVGGGITPMIGATPNLAWTHTTNFDDYCDVYELEMHPDKKLMYKYDDEYLSLEKKSVKLKVKVGPFVIPIKKKYYKSIHGPVIKNKDGYFAIRSNIGMSIKHIEQWYEMGKSKNYNQFWDALNIKGAASQTVTYADKEDNIMHINYALMPQRKDGYEYRGILDGNTSDNVWNMNDITPIEELVKIKNPSSGFVYNCNNTPFDCTGKNENPRQRNYPVDWGIPTSNTLRAIRFKELVNEYDQMSYQDIIDVRNDVSYPSGSLNFRNVLNMDDFFTVVNETPEFNDVQTLIANWDRKMDVNNKQAAFISLVSTYISKALFEKYAVYDNVVPKSLFVDAIKYAKKFLLKHYKTLEVELGEVQKLVRDDIELPMYGSPQTLANAHMEEYKKGKLKMSHGDTFIMYAQYGERGLESLKTINLFGSSEKADNPHYTSQMEMFVNQQVKDVPLDYETIKANASRIYNPGVEK